MDHWTILPTLAVRTTGFPIDLLERLRSTRASQLVRELLDVERALHAARADLLGRHLHAAVAQAARSEETRPRLRMLSTWRHQASRQRALTPPPAAQRDLPEALCAAGARWNALVARHAALRCSAEQAWREELVSVRQALWELAADPRLLEAIFLSNPDMHRALSAARSAHGVPERTSAVRRVERSLMSYVQRLCAKNETNSFFGPINYGRLDATLTANVHIVRAAAPVRTRTSFATQWMVDVLATTIAADPSLKPFLRPRRAPRFRLLDPGCVLDTATDRRTRLDARDARLVALADGTRTVSCLASALGEDLAATWTRLEQLGRAGLLVARLLVPGDRPDPLQHLLDWLGGVPDGVPARTHWLDIVSELQREVAALSDEDLTRRMARLGRIETLFATATGSDVRRGAGAMYADRALVFEECLGDLESFAFGGNLACAIDQRLQPIFRLWRTAARLRAERDQRAAHAVLSAITPSADGSVSLLRFLTQARRSAPAAHTSGDGLDALLADLRALVEARSDGHRARLSANELPTPTLPPERDACVYTSVDLLLDAPSEAAVQAGQFSLVIGEAHAPPLVWVFPTAYFLDRADAAFGTRLDHALRAQPGAHVAAQVALARDTKIFGLPLPGPTIELRAQYPDSRALPAASIDVRREDGTVSLCAAADGRRLRLYPPLKRRGDVDPFAALAFPAIEMLPIELGEHTPRIEIDGVVYQRERWVLPGGGPGEPGARDFELFVEAWRWKTRHGLPDEVFVRFPREPKPVYVDLANHFLIELFDHLARQNSAMTVSEMLPSSAGTWLRGPAGRYSAEYRAVAVAEVVGGDV